MYPLAEAASQMHVLAPVLLVHAHPITKAWAMHLSKSQTTSVRFVCVIILVLVALGIARTVARERGATSGGE